MAQKEIVTILNRFDLGVMNDKRTPQKDACRMVTNFDILTSPYKLRPRNDFEDGDINASTSKKQNFEVALRSGTTYALYALGVVSGTGRAEVAYKNLTTGASTDLDDNGWSATANNASSSGATNFNVFVYYKRTGLIYGARSGTHIWAYDPTGSAAFANTHQALTYTNIAQGLVHSKDDILYIPYDNKIAKNDNGSWTTAALTLPESLKITSIAEYGNFLAIACQPLSKVGSSVIYLWNRNDSLETLSERIDCEGLVEHIDVIDGVLVAVSYTGNQDARNTEKVMFSYYNNTAETEKIMELVADNNTAILLPSTKQHINSRLYFQMQITIDGEVRAGVWSFGRSATNRSFALTNEHYVASDYVSGDTLTGFFFIGDYLFQSYTDSGTYKLQKTDISAYPTAIYETVVNHGLDIDDRQAEKQLKALAVKTEPLASGEQVVVKYKVDEDTAWSSVLLTHETDNDVVKEVAKAFKRGRDFQFRLESTGGAVITSLKAVFERLDSLVR